MSEAIVKVEEGLLRGKLSVNYKNGPFYSFHGIPYAVPPLGGLRFKAPRQSDKWDEIRDATQERDGCISRNTYTGKIEGGEDCLFLNVYTPMVPSSKNTILKPVMVWIHGGAFQAGSTKTELYGPDYLLTQDIVLVTVSFRLGALGFLCLDDTTLGVTGNNAFRDIIMALKWVQRNITSFSGDPDNVTLFGESSGAVSAHYLMLSPLAKGLFHKIILQSGCALQHWAIGRRDSARTMVDAMGYEPSCDKDILNFLQNQPVEAIYEAQEKIKAKISPHIKRHFYPIIEQASDIEPPVIVEDPIKIIRKGDYNKVPMIIGYTSEEGLFFEFKIKKRTKNNKNNAIITNFEELIPHHLNIPQGTFESKYIANEIKTYYFKDEEPTIKHRKRYFELEADSSFNYLLYITAKIHLENLGYPIYYFRFSVDGKFNFYKQMHGSNFPGASHSDDVCYLFKLAPVKDVIEDSLEDITIQRMTKLWTNFARHGDPNLKEYNKNISAKWRPIENGSFNFLDIGKELTPDINPEHPRFQFWDKIYCRNPFLGKL